MFEPMYVRFYQQRRIAPAATQPETCQMHKQHAESIVTRYFAAKFDLFKGLAAATE
ncbi:MAG: hypothetical protein ABI831_04950 [Betaproteobacteria bacterium]